MPATSAPSPSQPPPSAGGAPPTGQDLDLARYHIEAALQALTLRDDPETGRTAELVSTFLAGFRPLDPPSPELLPTACRDLIVLRDLPFHSLCAHHLLPFFGTATLAMRPQGRVPGLGWFVRVLEAHARRPQVQERLSAAIADTIAASALAPTAVGVRLVARHMCMEMRGSPIGGSVELTRLRGEPDAELRQALFGRA
jgi:GTP cyclohydrolase I